MRAGTWSKISLHGLPVNGLTEESSNHLPPLLQNLTPLSSLMEKLHHEDPSVAIPEWDSGLENANKHASRGAPFEQGLAESPLTSGMVFCLRS